jgi:hypothetical protein
MWHSRRGTRSGWGGRSNAACRLKAGYGHNSGDGRAYMVEMDCGQGAAHADRDTASAAGAATRGADGAYVSVADTVG